MKRRDRRKGMAVLTGMLLAASLSGCVFSPDHPQTERVEEFSDLISVGFSQIGSESVWRSVNTVSFQESLTSENGYFLLYSNARQKQENQIKAIRSFISQQVDCIVFSPVTEDGWETVLSEARDAGIPVIASDRKVSLEDESLCTAWVGGDMVEEGEKAGRALEALLQDRGMESEVSIVVLQGTEGSSAAIGRTEGFHHIAAQHPGWQILEEQSADFTTAKGKEIMEQFLTRYPQIDVLISQNDDMTFGAIEALKEAGCQPGEDTIIVSFDAVREALELVQEGEINIDIECNPLLGPYVDALLKRLAAGEEIPRENPVEEMVFTRENVAAYLEERAY